MVSSYKEFVLRHLSGMGVSGGSNTTQQSFQNVTQSGVVTVTHDEDAISSRIVQIIEFEAGNTGMVNTSLNFDLLDEGDFIQEDSISGTDFVGGKVLLYDTGEGVSDWSEQQKIQASDKQEDDYFGYSVAIYANTAIIGAYNEGTGGTDVGAAYIFTRTAEVWTEQQKIQASDKEVDDRFGISVSVYGDTTIVGAYQENTGGLNTGAAYIFTRTAGVWTEQQKVQASDKEADDYFGYSVALYQDTAIVGAYNEDTGGDSAGAAYIFTRTAEVWTEQQKIQASDKESYDQFGYSVAIYANTSIVGAYYEDTGGSDAGAAYIFTRSGSIWTEQQKIQASDKEIGDRFGYSVAVYADTAIVGAYSEDTGSSGAGAAYIFTRSGSTWSEQQKIQASDKGSYDYFGISVAVYADTSIVGAYYEDTGAPDVGAAYIFNYETRFFYSISQPYYVTTSNNNQITLANISEINSCTITKSEPANTSIKCLASFDGRSTWKRWVGTGWLEHDFANISTANDVSYFVQGFTDLTIASGTEVLDFAFDLGTTNSGVTPEIDLITINYDEEGSYALSNMCTDYMVLHYSSIQTKVTKNSSGTKNIKVNVII